MTDTDFKDATLHLLERIATALEKRNEAKIALMNEMVKMASDLIASLMSAQRDRN